MILQGKLFAESPIYRGNARKMLFTRDGDGTQTCAPIPAALIPYLELASILHFECGTFRLS